MRAPAHFDNARNDGLIICEREDFSDYMWMADEESFDKQVLAELQEEEEMEQCMEEMLAEEEARDTTYYVVGNDWTQNSDLVESQAVVPVVAEAAALDTNEILTVSQLNPEASEFVPSRSAHQVSPTMAAEASAGNPSLTPASLSSSEDATLTKSGSSETPDR